MCIPGRKLRVLFLAGMAVLGLVALVWAIGINSSEAQEGAMHNCPQPGKWAITVWGGDDGTNADQAFATCGEGAVVAAYDLDPQTQGWSREDVKDAQLLTTRLESISQNWQSETRFNQGWVTIYCFGRSVFGAQRTKARGVELFFHLKENPEKSLPQGVIPRQMKETLCLSGKLDSIDDEQLRRLCEAALREVGVGPSPR